KWTVSVCTGSVLLAAAGLLAGKKATSHWAVLDRLPKFGAQPISERFVQDGKIITAAGVSAGIDMGLHLASLISGEDYSQMLQLVTEYYPEPPTKIGNASFVSQEIKEKTRSFLQSEISKMSSSGLY
ncbi:MAG: DJ-1/PfpI family protein, partial [Ginsengibacter sp.]